MKALVWFTTGHWADIGNNSSISNNFKIKCNLSFKLTRLRCTWSLGRGGSYCFPCPRRRFDYWHRRDSMTEEGPFPLKKKKERKLGKIFNISQSALIRSKNFIRKSTQWKWSWDILRYWNGRRQTDGCSNDSLNLHCLLNIF